MHRFALFVDGSNLYGSLRAVNVQVHDYEALYGYLFAEAAKTWAEITHQTVTAPAELLRVYWYVVGSMDDWDLSASSAQFALRGEFLRDRDIKGFWLARAERDNPGAAPAALEEKAWSSCISDFQAWYEGRWRALEGMKRFYQGVRIGTNLIDVIESGHWKVNFLHKLVDEKGLDTSLAVDMVALANNYDVAVVVTGDADSIPSIRHVKNQGKHVAAVEFINGSSAETRGRTFSSRLKEHADFVLRIYETDLLKLGLGSRPLANTSGDFA